MLALLGRGRVLAVAATDALEAPADAGDKAANIAVDEQADEDGGHDVGNRLAIAAGIVLPVFAGSAYNSVRLLSLL